MKESALTNRAGGPLESLTGAAASAPSAGSAPSVRTAGGLRAQLGNLGQLLGSHAIVGLVGLASLPTLARNFGAEAYGRFSLFVLLLGALSNLDITRPILIRSLSRDDRAEAVDGPALAVTSSGLLALIALALGWSLGGPLMGAALAAGVYLHGLASVAFARLSADGRVGIAGSIRNGFWAAALTSVVVASFFTRSPHAWVWAFGAANLGILCAYRRVAAGTGVPWARPRLGVLRQVRSQGTDILIFAIASAAVASLDKLLLEQHTDAATFGRYAAQYDLAIKINIASSALTSILYPMLSRLHAESGPRAATGRFVSLSSRLAVLYFVGLGTLILLQEQVLDVVFGATFTAEMDSRVYGLMLVGVFVHLFGFLVTPYQRARGDFRTHRIAYMTSACLMLGVGLFAIPRFGAVGAVVTYLTARTAEIALVLVEARRTSPDELPRVRIAAYAVMVAILAGLALAGADLGGTP